MSRQLVYCSVIVILMAMLVNHGALSRKPPGKPHRGAKCTKDGYGLSVQKPCGKCPKGTFIKQATEKNSFKCRSTNYKNKCNIKPM